MSVIFPILANVYIPPPYVESGVLVASLGRLRPISELDSVSSSESDPMESQLLGQVVAGGGSLAGAGGRGDMSEEVAH